MKEELDDKLCRAYPNLYADRNADKMSTCMCWGFDCGDGWYEIVDKLSAGLERPGGPRAFQVKEKWGILRFYVDNATDLDYDLIRDAEKQSCDTCEDCGDPGELRTGGWLRTLCRACQERRT